MTKFGGKIDAAANRLTYTIIDAVFYSLLTGYAAVCGLEVRGEVLRTGSDASQ